MAENGACIPSKSCDFEVDLCDLANTEDSKLLWKRKQYQDGINDPDHTTSTNSGSFAYLAFEIGSVTGDKGVLISPKYKPVGFECLQFWYLIKGNSIGQLNVRVFSQNQYSTPLWSKIADQVTEWRYGQVEIRETQNEYSFVFEGIRGTENTGITALDDVILKSGACMPPINCNFEDETTCSWTQSIHDDQDWLLVQGKSGTFLTHGYFLWLKLILC